MSNRRKTTLTHEGWYYVLVVAFIVVGAVWQQVNLMIVLAGLMVGPLLLGWRVTAATMRQIRVDRYMPDCVHAGESFAVEIVVRNLRRRLGSWFVVVSDYIGRVGTRAATHSTRVEVLLPRVAPRQSSRTTYRCTLPERGSYTFGTMSVSTKFPLGLLKCRRRIDSRQTMVVLPRLGRLTKSWYELIQSRQAGVRQPLHRRALTSGGDFYGVRDWQPSDSRRLIHWRITAKLGQLAVRQFEELDNFDVTVVLDLWQTDVDDARASVLVETAVSFAATVVKDVCRQSGTGLRVFLLGDEMLQLGGPATAQLGQRVLWELAFRSSSCGYDTTSQLMDVAASTQRAEQIIVISTRSHVDAGFALDSADKSVQLLARRVTWLFVGGTTAEQCFAISPQAVASPAAASRPSRFARNPNVRAKSQGAQSSRPAAGDAMQ